MAILAVALLGAWMVHKQWRAEKRIMNVRIINARTNQETFYQARKKAIHMRTFETLDGRRVTLADVERMEVTEPDPLPYHAP